jgi:hypothetical protein
MLAWLTVTTVIGGVASERILAHMAISISRLKSLSLAG